MRHILKLVGVFAIAMLAIALGMPSLALAESSVRALPDTLNITIVGATLGASVATLLDHAKRMEPNGSVAKVAELLSQSNAILEDMQWKEGNLPTGERVTVRTGLPSVAWRLLNKGVAKSKSTTAQIDEQVGMLEARSEIDVDLAALNGNSDAFRLSEASAFLEAMNQEFAQTLLYGNSGTAQEEFTGLAVRYSSLSAANGQNIINAGGVQSDNTSIWLVVWGPNSVYGIFPKGSKAGLVHEDLGTGDAFDSDNNRFRALMDRWQWKGGIALKDWRYVVRIANIDVSSLVADASGATVKLMEYMSKAIDRIPTLGMGRPVFYANRTVASMLRLQAMNKSVANIGFHPAVNQFGKSIHELQFNGIPVRLVDQILETEALVS